VREARLALETVLSKQHAATGGAAALKSMAESFGPVCCRPGSGGPRRRRREARKAALAAQAVAAAGRFEPRLPQPTATPAPAVESVPAFTLLSDSPAGLFAGTLEDGAPETVPAAVAYSDRPSAGACRNRRRSKTPCNESAAPDL